MLEGIIVGPSDNITKIIYQFFFLRDKKRLQRVIFKAESLEELSKEEKG